MARESKLSKLASINISAKYSKKDLMNYIRTVTDYVNSSIKSREIRKNEQLLKSANIIGERYGIKRGIKKRGMLEVGGKKGLLKYDIYGKSKDELLTHARLLKAHLGIDEYTKVGREIMNEKMKRAYEKFKKFDVFSDTSEDEYIALVNVFGQMGADLVEKYGSDEIRNLFLDLRSENAGLSKNFVDIARDIYRENSGISNEDLAELLYDAIEDLKNQM